MRKYIVAIAASAALLASGHAQEAMAGNHYVADRWARRFAATIPWHAPYYHTAYGRPVALMVPPTVNMQRSMAWGVAQTEMMPIYHRFSRDYPGAMFGQGVTYGPTPRWPSHTDQFGVYYARGPWGPW